jgi:hypothetical protein
MGSHHPFGALKHKLWPKEGSGVKLAIWLLTTKSLESPQFTCVYVVWHIPLKSSWRRLQLCFKPHFIRRYAHKVMYPQNRKSPSCGNFRTPTWESWNKNDIWVLVLWPGTKYTIRGKVVASPKFGPWWVLWVHVCSWLICAPKCCNYALSNLLFGLCRFVWVIEVLVNLFSPIPEL